MLVYYYFFLSLHFVPLASFLLLSLTCVMCHTAKINFLRKAHCALSRPPPAPSVQPHLALTPEVVTTSAGRRRDGAKRRTMVPLLGGPNWPISPPNKCAADPRPPAEAYVTSSGCSESGSLSWEARRAPASSTPVTSKPSRLSQL